MRQHPINMLFIFKKQAYKQQRKKVFIIMSEISPDI